MGARSGKGGRHQRQGEQGRRKVACVCRSHVRVCARAGEKAAATVRGTANAEKDKCKEMLTPSQIEIFAPDLTEISVQKVIDKVLKCCVVDGDTVSLAAFNEACPASQT